MTLTVRLGSIFLLLLACSTATHAAMTLDELQQRSAKYPVIRAEFEQTRHISGLSQPLVSRGKLIISQQQGLWWQQSKPFPLTLLLTEQKMVQTIVGQPPEMITAQSNPQMFQFNHLLTALFHADRVVLEQNFTIELVMVESSTPNKQHWQLRLKPKTTPLDKLFRQITLTGDEFLERIEIDDMQNDKSVIRFFNHIVQPQSLTNEERQHFAS